MIAETKPALTARVIPRERLPRPNLDELRTDPGEEHALTRGAQLELEVTRLLVATWLAIVTLLAVTTPVWSGVWTVSMAFQTPGNGKR